MNTNILQFGESHPDFPVRVLNEREVRGAAGIMFFVAVVAFMNAWSRGDFAPTQITVVVFFVDFFIRVMINPRFSPSLVLARLLVRSQVPEYVGAAQKRFAWSIGLALASLMMVLVVFNDVRGPANILTCALCLVLLFFESAFGICIGCRLYNLFHREQAQLCPGGVCEIHDRQPIQQVSRAQYLVLACSILALVLLLSYWPETRALHPSAARGAPQSGSPSAADTQRCIVPEFAKRMGHEEKWKLHNGCS